MLMDEAKDELAVKYVERESLFTPGTINSYRRDRYERYDKLTLEIDELEKCILGVPSSPYGFIRSLAGQRI